MYIAIRIRGSCKVSYDIKDTLKLLRLTRVNHAVLLRESDQIKGMLKKVKDYIAWGEIDHETLKKLLYKRGRLIGDKKLNDEYVQNLTAYDNIDALAKAIVENKFVYSDIEGIKPIFRLEPPRGGFKNTKRGVHEKGSLGYHGTAINRLVLKMIGW